MFGYTIGTSYVGLAAVYFFGDGPWWIGLIWLVFATAWFYLGLLDRRTRKVISEIKKTREQQEALRKAWSIS